MNTKIDAADPRLLLQRELERRCQSNPRYSLRAFAKALGMSPTALSLVLSGKRPLSKKAALKLAETLTLAPQEYQAMLRWANPRAALAEAPSSTYAGADAQAGFHQMSLDSFSFVSEWYHYAILSLLELPKARCEARWVSKRLGITEVEAKSAIERLQRMELIEKVDGRWKQAVGPIRIGNNVPTAATKKYQKQLLHKAIESLENDPVETRDFSSMTLAMSEDQIPFAREEIRKFRRALAQELEARSKPNRVYEFTVQIFPVSKDE